MAFSATGTFEPDPLFLIITLCSPVRFHTQVEVNFDVSRALDSQDSLLEACITEESVGFQVLYGQGWKKSKLDRGQRRPCSRSMGESSMGFAWKMLILVNLSQNQGTRIVFPPSFQLGTGGIESIGDIYIQQTTEYRDK